MKRCDRPARFPPNRPQPVRLPVDAVIASWLDQLALPCSTTKIDMLFVRLDVPG